MTIHNAIIDRNRTKFNSLRADNLATWQGSPYDTIVARVGGLSSQIALPVTKGNRTKAINALIDLLIDIKINT